FGEVKETPQTEETPFHPRSPYGVTKVVGFEMTRNYREAYNFFACSGILFNHESPRRGKEFVTRKISSGVAKAKAGKENVIVLGNLDAKRDWGYSKEYVEAMWKMLQQDIPGDYVIATGESHSIRDFLDCAFRYANLNYQVVDLHEYLPDEANRIIESLRQKKDEIFVVQHPSFYRPAEVNELLGNADKAKKELGWKPKTSFKELVEMMVENDLAESRNKL
ncbi:MAG TPA: GDP-mannose 4,6-dehydratase, partial [Candidatus Omnitrophota bacterium]|nr:GDP-mannose 4,6-dehydratase [Candidatus Omnitrophota bacterium]